MAARQSLGRPGDRRDLQDRGESRGRIHETTRARDEHLWGTVTPWQPPHRLARTQPPGRTPDEATTVEMSFRPMSGDRTRLALVHGGWPAGAAARRARYGRGWEALLRVDYAADVRDHHGGLSHRARDPARLTR